MRRDGGGRAGGRRALLASRVRGQDGLHRPYGGVVPELASRDHVRAASRRWCAQRSPRRASPRRELDAVAVTAARACSARCWWACASRRRSPTGSACPASACITWRAIWRRRSWRRRRCARPISGWWSRAGTRRSTASRRAPRRSCSARRATTPWARPSTRSRSCSACRTRAARRSRELAEAGREDAFALPRPLARRAGLRLLLQRPQDGGGAHRASARGRSTSATRADLAASFQAAATDVLVAKARRALEGEALARLAVVGGVAANQRLRAARGGGRARDGFERELPAARALHRQRRDGGSRGRARARARRARTTST